MAEVKSKRVLILDDEEIILKATSKMLMHLGYDAEVSKTGYDTIEIYKKSFGEGNPFDAVIMDLTIPGGLGAIEVVSKIKEFDPNVTAILSSGYAEDDIMDEYTNLGFKSIIIKPYGVSDLENRLKELIG